MTTQTVNRTRNWSTQQEAIFDWFANPAPLTATLGERIYEAGRPARERRNLVVRARAGTGKTTTIIEGVNRAPEQKILLCAFNKRIADELTTRITNPNAQAKTLHAIGFGIVVRYWEGLRVSKTDSRDGLTRKDDLTNRVVGARVPDAVRKLVTKLHCLGREIEPLAQGPRDLEAIALNFECEPDEEWQSAGYDLETVCGYAYRAMELAAAEKPVKTGIDFSDMIFLPVRNHWMAKAYDLVVVDEAQDMTVAQLAIARGVCRGRMAIVGDDRQAIYGFRGADSGSLDRLKAELGADELGLTKTYRCGRTIVEQAQAIVPDFSAGPNNPEGRVTSLPYDKLAETVALGDFVLSRKNAVLVATAMALLRAGKRTKIAGRDIGAGLKALVRKLTKSAKSIPAFLERLAAWEDREKTRALAAGRDGKIEEIEDRAGMLRNLAEEAKSVTDVEAKIDALFTDDGLGQAGVITCSSVHRAKGLEADRVFILTETLRTDSEEELNIQYVAITRAKEELVWVN